MSLFDRFILTLSPASSCHYHVLHLTLPHFNGFAQQSVRVLSSTVAFLTQSLRPSVSFVRLPYHHRVRILHRCPNCFYHYIVVSIIVAMSYHALLRFVCIFAQQSVHFLYICFTLCCRMWPICRHDILLHVTYCILLRWHPHRRVITAVLVLRCHISPALRSD